MSITSLFEKLGAPLANPRWSGVASVEMALSSCVSGRTKPDASTGSCMFNLPIRGFSLDGKTILGIRSAIVTSNKSGLARSYMVMCEPKSTQTVPREIKGFNEREVFVAGGVIEHHGDLWVPIADREPVSQVWEGSK